MNALLPTGVVAGESWFDLLDQRRFAVGDTCWTAQVAGVHLFGFDTWIQLEFAEDGRRSLLRLIHFGQQPPYTTTRTTEDEPFAGEERSRVLASEDRRILAQ
jgi:hypothetical protein